ncbi:hypothetical protein D6C95_10060 [Aureobasidium pullulans]|nr:hypothetical protein D6C95_10060 [Aureobasidium pullulans]THY80890.1 hypothetical protein D6C92_10522 [Aureobasidium pullulans]TIA06058.1 hypothetical protein D6C81_10083 [Aureobasidium pullulans]
MSSSQHIIESHDIYHGLPTFEEEGLTAIVTGANGISGTYMLKVLGQHPQRWKKIYALSRRPPSGDLPKNVEHIPCDFLKSPEEIASVLKEKNVKGDYAFFFAYIQPAPKEGQGIWGNVDELVSINKSLLSNFLEALTISKSIPKAVLLQLGAKYYGLHLGPGTPPYEETNARVELEPNFYYPQEDYLREWAKKNGSKWITTRPSHIPGAVPDNAMNLVLPLAIYATVQKHLGLPLEYPSDLKAWETTVSISSAQMNAYLSEWAVLTDSAYNESFNACDDSAFTWAQLWPRLAARFGIDWKGPDLEADFTESKMPYEPPPRGWGPTATMKYKFTLTEWAKKPEIQKAWKEIAEANGLRMTEFSDIDRVFGFTDGALGWSFPLHYSMTKAKEMGYFGYVDSTKSIIKTVEEFADLKMIPKLP